MSEAKRGRPSKLTPDLRARLLAAIRGGNYRQTACQWVGIDYTTFARWMRESKADPDGPHGPLYQEVLEAETAAEIQAVANLVKAGRDDPKLTQWWLERKFPERWGSQTKAIRDLEKRVAELQRQIAATDDGDAWKRGG